MHISFSRLLFVVLISGTMGFCCSGAMAAPRFGENQLDALLNHDPRTGKAVDSVADLIPLLPGEFRRNFTFVYASRSPFRASISPGHPRIILFSADARLVLTFTGDPDKPGADVLETMAFDDATASFSLHVHVLPAAARRGFAPSAEGRECASCHGADPRPIFDSYPLWPGFYGSVLDSFPRDGLGSTELRRYAAFLKGAARSGVYAALRFPAGSRTSPYLDPGRFSDHTFELDPSGLQFLPNARLGMALTELNRQRIYRKLSAASGFAAAEQVILSDLLACPGSAAPKPVTLRSVARQVSAENRARLKRLGVGARDRLPSLHAMQELGFLRELASLRQAAALANIDMADWSMALEPNSSAFFDGILSGRHGRTSYYLKEDLIYEILAHLSARDSRFRRFFASDAVFAEQGYPFGRRLDIGRASRACLRLDRHLRRRNAGAGGKPAPAQPSSWLATTKVRSAGVQMTPRSRLSP